MIKFIISLSSILLLCNCQTTPTTKPLSQKFNISEVNGAAVGRLFVLPVKSPVRRELQRDEKDKRHFEELMKLFEFFVDLIEQRRAAKDPQICNFPSSEDWVVVTGQILKARQIGGPSKECNTRLRSDIELHRGAFTQEFIKNARKTVQEGRSAMFNSFKRAFKSKPEMNVLTRPDLSWEMGPLEVKGWSLIREGQTCTLDRVSSYVVNGSVYAMAEVTNRPVDAVMEDGKRQGMNEYIHRDLTSSIHMVHPLYNTSAIGGEAGNLSRQTNLISRWSGSTKLATVGNMNFDENPAVQEAYQTNLVQVDLASDAVTISNIAILALPMLMNLVPVAVLADFQTWATACYIIFTDIVSCIPFMIKGMELIIASSGKKDHLAVDRSGDMRLGQLEIYIASCRGTDNFRGIGIAFVVFSIVAIILGATLEIVTSHWVRQNKIKKLTDEDGMFGLSFYFKKSEMGVWPKMEDEEREEKFRKEQSRRYSQEGQLFLDDSNTEDTRDKGWWPV